MDIEFVSNLSGRFIVEGLGSTLDTLLSEAGVTCDRIEKLLTLRFHEMPTAVYLLIWHNPYHPLIPILTILSEEAISYKIYRFVLAEARRFSEKLRYDFDPANTALRRALSDSGYTLVRRTALYECDLASIPLSPLHHLPKIEKVSAPLSSDDARLLSDYYRACHASVSPFDPSRTDDELIQLLTEDLDARYSYRLLEGDRHILWTTAIEAESAELLYLAGNREAIEDAGFCHRFFHAVIDRLASEKSLFVGECDDTDPLARLFTSLITEAAQSYWETWVTL